MPRRRRWSRSDDPAAAAWHVVAVVENVPFGADHRLRKQVDTLLAHGCRVSVIGPRDEVNAPYRDRAGLRLLEYPAPPEPGGPMGHLREYAWSGVCAASLLLSVRARTRVDVVQLCQPPDIYFPLMGLVRLAGSRVVVDQRDLMPELLLARYPSAPRRASAVLHGLERWTQRTVDHTITVNDYLRERLEEAGGRGRVSVVWNGPVLSRVDAVRADADGESAGRPAGVERTVVWVGKMGVQDRVDLVVEVAGAVVDAGRDDIGFVLIGDGECLADLQDQVRRRGIERWVTFTGWVPEAAVFGYLAAADLGLDTSLQDEVTPVKALEYMSFGLAFAAFDLPETRRLAAGAAQLTPAGDVPALVRSVLELMDDEQRRLSLGRAGRRRVQDALSWERQEDAYLAAVGPSASTPHSV